VRAGGARYWNAAGAAAYLSFNYSGSNVPTGATIYTSYLVKLVSPKTQASVVSLRFNTSKTNGATTAFFAAQADSNVTTDSMTGAQYGTGNANSTGAGTAISENTTYLVIGRFTYAGTATGTRVATLFVLNEAQFTNYLLGSFGEAQWETATIGTGADQIVSRATDTYTGTSSFNLARNGAIQAGIGNAGSNQDVLYDEIRVASTLADAIPADPPPATALVSLEVANAPATEPTTPSPTIGRFRIRRQDASTGTITVQINLTGTASNGQDYLPLPNSVIIPQGTTWVDVEVRPLGDRKTEGNESVTLSITASSAYTVDGPDNMTLIITDGPLLNAPTQLLNRLAEGTPQKIVVYGTSLTAGGAWPTQVASALNTVYPGLVTLVNSGGSGMNSKWGLTNLQSKVISHAPHVVFIEFSTNDSVTRVDYEYLITPKQARDNLNAMIDGIQASLPNCEIILQVMNPIIGTSATYRANLTLCQQIYRNVGKERGLLVIDHMSAWQAVLNQGSTTYMGFVPDGLHPNEGGYAQYVTPSILQQIGHLTSIPKNSVILHANNQRAAEPVDSSTPAVTSLITVSRNSACVETAWTIPLNGGGTCTFGADVTALPSSVTIPIGAHSASILLTPLQDSLIEGPETVTVTASPTGGITVTSPSAASLFIEDTPYDTWKHDYFLLAEWSDPAISGDDADPDHDGITNLMEFMTGHPPKSTDSGGAAVFNFIPGSGINSLSLTYNLSLAAKGTIITQTSSNLIDWNEGPSFIEETILSDDGITQTIRAQSVPTGDQQLFMRLRAPKNPMVPKLEIVR